MKIIALTRGGRAVISTRFGTVSGGGTRTRHPEEERRRRGQDVGPHDLRWTTRTGLGEYSKASTEERSSLTLKTFDAVHERNVVRTPGLIHGPGLREITSIHLNHKQ